MEYKRRPRVIPFLLLKDGGLVKTIRFKNPRYVGDPINAVRIFNDSEVDELCILDISGKWDKNFRPRKEALKHIAEEAFMPMSYGGGIRTLKEIEEILKIGFEKVVLNTVINADPQLVKEAVSHFGSSTMVASVDIKTTFLGKKKVMVDYGKRALDVPYMDYLKKIEDLGFGEVVLTSMELEGTRKGLDKELIQSAVHQVSVPLVAHGGAQDLSDLRRCLMKTGASGVGAGTIFVMHGPLNGILINYPTQSELQQLLVMP